MIDFDFKLNIEQELSEIPTEYQEAFRQAIERELADSEQNRTDTDILNYLRQRRDDFKRGSFIRPDGRPGMVALNPDTIYEQALPELAQSSLGEPDNTGDRRRTIIKMAVFTAVLLLFLFIAFHGRAQRANEQALLAEEASLNEVVPVPTTVNNVLVPTPPIPEVTGIDDSLQTIGSLGGALTIGRPSAIELHYGRTEETIALPIDPSKPTTKGEMRYNEFTMLSANPVAVWIFGTLINYGIGIPDSMARNLERGDRITLSTDTGASLHFVVSETRLGANYDATRMLSQNRLGMTLFSLPAGTEGEVTFVLANYDVANEDGNRDVIFDLGQAITLPDGEQFAITAVRFSHDAHGDIRVAVDGQASSLATGQSMVLSLAANNQQTTAVELVATDNATWQAEFSMPDAIAGLPLFANVRLLPDGHLITVQLGTVPILLEQLHVEITEAWWNEAMSHAHFLAHVENAGVGDVYLTPDFIQLSEGGRAVFEGGDAYALSGQITPHLPFFIRPGEVVEIQVIFLPESPSIRVQIGTDLWEITDIPPKIATPISP